MNISILKQKTREFKLSLLLTVLSLLMVLLNGCSGGLKLTSDWQQRELKIDGNDSQWQRGLYYDKESDLVYGVRNDEKNIYVFLKTQNRSTQMQIMKQGLTVWFDREDGKNQTFGILYPISRQDRRAGFIPDTAEEKITAFFDQEFPELEVLGPKKEDIQRFSALEAPGIRVKLSRSRDALIYELSVPLNKTSDQPFAIEPASSNRVGIEFETGEFNPEQIKGGKHADGGGDRGEGMSEGASGDGSGMGGGRRSHSGGNQGGHFGNTEKTKRMELWLSVQLAKPVSQ